MAVRKVLKAGHPRVRATTPAVSEELFDSEQLYRLIDDMIDTMRDHDGVGLAAPQAQESLQLFVYELRPNPRYPDIEEHVGPEVLVNPTITDRSTETEMDWEGCLTLPDLRGKVPRSVEVDVEFRTPDGEQRTQSYDGFEARVIQHEVDHLNGNLYIDRMHNMESLCYDEQYWKYQKDGEEGGNNSGEQASDGSGEGRSSDE
ncbi:MAG: peptide deformylase [bacterium]